MSIIDLNKNVSQIISLLVNRTAFNLSLTSLLRGEMLVGINCINFVLGFDVM